MAKRFTVSARQRVGAILNKPLSLLAWQVDRGDPLPLGVPQLMMAFVEDGQASEELVRQRNDYYKISAEEKQRLRADIPEPKSNNGADAWRRSGKAVQLTTSESKMKFSK